MMEQETQHFADVLLPVPLPGLFTYTIPLELMPEASPGKRVVVPFGPTRIMAGLIRKITTTCNTTANPKEILEIPDEEPIIQEEDFLFWEWIARYYLCAPGEVMQAALPAMLRLESQTSVALHPDFDGDKTTLSDQEFLVVEALQYTDRLTLKKLTDITGHPRVINLVQGLIEKQVVVARETMSEAYRPKRVTVVDLAQPYRDEKALEELFNTLEKRAYKQLELLMTWIRLTGFPERTAVILRQRLLKEASASPAALTALVDKGVFTESAQEASRLDKQPQEKDPEELQLSPSQEQALQQIQDGFSNNKPVLLHGVTGSGKTEIYIRLIHEAIKRKQQVLYLLPEIALTSQIINRMKAYFGHKVQVFHSRTNDHERAELWKNLISFNGHDDDISVVVCARSGIFLPFRNPGLIIVDEEHDHSFKQFEPAPRYHARDSALMLAKLRNIPIVMGSATPSIESYHHATHKRFQLVELLVRYGSAQMPKVEIANVSEAISKKAMRSHFTPQLVHAIKEALAQKKQVILFQNRRGFSLRLFCSSCGWHPGCPHCDVTLTYHKSINKLKCHYCGHMSALPTSCSECGSKEIRTGGFGTEKIAEESALLFANARVKRMDFDTTRTKDAYQSIINAFEQRETDILVGTQMVTKGLDFSNVSVVGVMNADSMIYFPDFRSFERSFQHIVQVSGRAGRHTHEGRVVVQSSRPTHDVLLLARQNHYKEMYRLQAEERRLFGYPPFTRLIRIVVKSKNNQLAGGAAHDLAASLRNALAAPVLGPEYPLVAKIRNEYLRHILIKLPRNKNPGAEKRKIEILTEEARKKSGSSKVRFVIDVDPY